MVSLIKCFFSFFLSLICYGAYHRGENDRDNACGDNISIISPEGIVNEDVLRILEILELNNSRDPSEVNRIMQENLLRKTERSEVIKKSYSEEKNMQLFQCFDNLRMRETVLPKNRNYDDIIIHGSTVVAMIKRMTFFLEKCAPFIIYKRIILLSGDRALSVDEKNNEIICKISEKKNIKISTEAEAAKEIWCYLTNEKQPLQEMILISAPATIDSNGNKKRPTTYDTIVEWLRIKPDSKTCLAISSNPYIDYQHAVVKNTLDEKKESIYLETIGAHSKEMRPEIYLDSLARWFYEEYKLYKKNNQKKGS